MKKIIVIVFLSFVFQGFGLSTLNVNNIDSLKVKNFRPFVGLQVGGSTSIAPLFGYEIRLTKRFSIHTSLTLGVDIQWIPPSFEFIPKTRINYHFNKTMAITFGIASELRINPWYLNNPNSYNFPTNCMWGTCPTTKFIYYYDTGIKFSLFPSKNFSMIPLYTYFPNQKKVMDIYGSFFTVEFIYNL